MDHCHNCASRALCALRRGCLATAFAQFAAGDKVSVRSAWDGGHMFYGTVKSIADGCVYVDRDGIDGSIMCDPTLLVAGSES